MTGPAANPGAASTARAWIVRLAAAEVAAEDLDRFKAWIAADPAHRAAFERERATWRDLQVLERDFAPRPVAAAKPRRRLVQMAMLAAAACLAIAIGYQPLRIALTTDYGTGTGQRASVTLPDGSVAHLNTDSAIAVRYSAGERRIVLLRGEVLFAVRGDPAKPFRVAALGGISEAVGTAFVVRDRGDQVLTTVTRGKVAVASPEQGQADTTLQAEAGDQIAYRAGQPPRRMPRADIGAVTAWQQGRIVLDGASFADALAELERYHPGRIVLVGHDPASLRPVSGIFATDRVDQAVAGLAATHGLTVSRLGNFLTILR